MHGVQFLLTVRLDFPEGARLLTPVVPLHCRRRRQISAHFLKTHRSSPVSARAIRHLSAISRSRGRPEATRGDLGLNPVPVEA